MIEHKEKIQGDSDKAILRNRIREMQERRERFSRGSDRRGIKELDREIERLMKELGV